MPGEEDEVLQHAPVTPVSLEIDGRSWTAADPREICRGECAGTIEYIPNREGYVAHPGDHADGKRIYVCDSASMALRPLIPHALGFVFGEGATLGHFSGVLRHHRIPACIDQHLWRQAREALLAAGSGSQGRLCCSRAVVLPEVVRAQYLAQLEGYRRRLGGHPLALPVYDVSGRAAWVATDEAVDVRIGEKALAVNALQVEGFPTARALILANLTGQDTRLDKDLSFVALVERIFPLFGHVPGYALMVRGSLYSADGSHSAWSGLLPSPAVTSLPALASAVASHVSRWRGVQDDGDHRPGLSIILQERVTAPVRGVLGTGRPWDYNAQGVVAELTLNHGTGAAQDEVFLGDVQAGLRNGLVRQTARSFFRQNATIDAEGFCETFACLVRDALLLRDRYSVPLDIEFVITGDLHYVFVQFRPLFRL